jgi:hypothetical protein
VPSADSWPLSAKVHGIPTYGAGGAATVVGATVAVGVGTCAAVAAVGGAIDGRGAGRRLDLVEVDGEVVDVAGMVDVDGEVDDVWGGVAVGGVSALPPRVAYTPSTAATTVSTPTAEARIGTAGDFRRGGATTTSPLRSCVEVSGSTILRLGNVAAERVGAEAG